MKQEYEYKTSQAFEELTFRVPGPGQFKVTIQSVEDDPEVPDVPTRVERRACRVNEWSVVSALPKDWAGADITVILGRDELPQAVKDAMEDIMTSPTAKPYRVQAFIDWVHGRWPEAFKP